MKKKFLQSLAAILIVIDGAMAIASTDSLYTEKISTEGREHTLDLEMIVLQAAPIETTPAPPEVTSSSTTTEQPTHEDDSPILGRLSTQESNLNRMQLYAAFSSNVPKTPAVPCLLQDIIPKAYDIQTEPHLEEMTFDGQTTIEIHPRKTCTSLTLHAKNLSFNEMSVATHGIDIYHQMKRYSINTATDLLTIEFHHALPSNQSAYLKLKYKGTIKSESPGFYKNEHMALVELVPGLARTVFPCWDDPLIRAKFKISVKHNNKTVLSNMAIDNECQNPNEIACFSESPPMAAHDVSFFMASNVKCINKSSQPVDGDPSLEYCTETSSLNLPMYLNYRPQFFEAMAKMGDALVPYGEGGFKNVKLAVLGENPATRKPVYVIRCGLIIIEDDPWNEEAIRQFINYAVAYHFFLCMVSPEVGAYPWLTHGLAAYYENLITMENDETDVDEDYKNLKKFIAESEIMKFEQDKKIAATISKTLADKTFYEVHDYKVRKAFELKAEVIVRMAIRMVGDHEFKHAVRQYIRNNLMSPTTSDSFIEELKLVAESKLPFIADIIHNWLSLPGIPSILVQTDDSYTSDNISEADSKHFWIPLDYMTNDEQFNSKFSTNISEWFTPRDRSREVIDIQDQYWLVVNDHRSGYYRVNYDKHYWQKIIQHIGSVQSENNTIIDSTNCAMLVDDAFHFFETCQLDYQIMFNVLEGLGNESSLLPWIIAERRISKIFDLLITSKTHTFKDKLASLTELVSAKMFGLLSQDSQPAQYYPEYNGLFSFICRLGHGQCDLEMMYSTSRLTPTAVNGIICCDNKDDVVQLLSDMFADDSIEVPVDTLFHLINMFVMNEIEYDSFETLFNFVINNMEAIRRRYEGSPEKQLIWGFIDIINNGNPKSPPDHELRAYIADNKKYLVKYWLSYDIERYLFRSSPEYCTMDPTDPGFKSFVKIPNML